MGSDQLTVEYGIVCLFFGQVMGFPMKIAILCGVLMKVGDLVTLEKWCLNHDRPAIVMRITTPGMAWILWADGLDDSTWEPGHLRKEEITNLRIISEV
jgi:hypothetical protein